MGIKFHCPNGHKLNVKSFLAGKKGVCPKCGTKVRIPEISEPGLDDGADGDSDAGKMAAEFGQAPELPGNGAAVKSPAAGLGPAPVIPTAMPALPTAKPIAPIPATTMPVAAVPVAAVPVAAAPVGPMAPQPQMLAAPGALAPARPAVPADPIAEAPMAIWYVRPPSGGQFGPARGDVMRKWIGEGRVSGDSLVWREGWADWQTAGKLFPQLQAASAPTPAIAADAAGVSRATRTVSRYQAKKSGGNSAGIALLIGLAIVCLALMAVLAYVLFGLK
jgi:hypothetical protein